MSVELESAYTKTVDNLRLEAKRFLRQMAIDVDDIDAPRNHYVYLLLRPVVGAPERYIGKGYGDRIHKHERFGIKHPNVGLRSDFKNYGRLDARVIIDCLTEYEAFEIEKLLISKIGREDIGIGPLANRTDGGEGPSGAVASDETREKLRAASRERQARIFGDPDRAEIARQHLRKAARILHDAISSDPVRQAEFRKFASERSKAMHAAIAADPIRRAENSARMSAFSRKIHEKYASNPELAAERLAKFRSTLESHLADPEWVAKRFEKLSKRSVSAAQDIAADPRRAAIKKAKGVLTGAVGHAVRWKSPLAISKAAAAIGIYESFCKENGIDGSENILRAREKLSPLIEKYKEIAEAA